MDKISEIVNKMSNSLEDAANDVDSKLHEAAEKVNTPENREKLHKGAEEAEKAIAHVTDVVGDTVNKILGTDK